MKSAGEIRALMIDRGNPMIQKVMSRLESEIIKATKLGYGHVVVFVPVEICSFTCARNINSQMLGLGYECKIEQCVRNVYVADRRDGDCIKFSIKW